MEQNDKSAMIGFGIEMTTPEQLAQSAEEVDERQGHKADTGKLPWALLPFDAVRQVVEVLHFGQKKYAARNWEKGIDYDRVYSAAMRHMTDWWQREQNDQESKLHHLAHAMCCIMFLLAFELRNMVWLDNRPEKKTRLVNIPDDILDDILDD